MYENGKKSGYREFHHSSTLSQSRSVVITKPITFRDSNENRSIYQTYIETFIRIYPGATMYLYGLVIYQYL